MRKMLIITLFAAALAACGQAAQGPTAGGGPTALPSTPAQPSPEGLTVAPPSTRQPTAAPAASGTTVTPAPTTPLDVAPLPIPTVTRMPRPGGDLSVRPPDALVAAAQSKLASYLGVGVDQVQLQSANREEWPDGALGCPQEGMAYPQVVTPGFLLIFSNPSQSQTYEVHTAESEARLILCENKQPVDLNEAASAQPPTAISDAAMPVDDAARHVVDLARAALAQELGITRDAVTLVSVEATDWNDSSLGCPKEGQAYLQVITPGYRIVLEAKGNRYEYHSDNGSRVVRCDTP